MQSSLKALETSLYWQRVVLRQSINPQQQQRCQRAIQRLTDQIQQLGGAV